MTAIEILFEIPFQGGALTGISVRPFVCEASGVNALSQIQSGWADLVSTVQRIRRELDSLSDLETAHNIAQCAWEIIAKHLKGALPQLMEKVGGHPKDDEIRQAIRGIVEMACSDGCVPSPFFDDSDVPF